MKGKVKRGGGGRGREGRMRVAEGMCTLNSESERADMCWGETTGDGDS